MLKETLQRLNLAQRLAMLSTGLCLVVGLVLVLVASVSGRFVSESVADQHGQTLARQLASRSSSALLNNDRISLRAILEEFVSDTQSDLGTIYDVTMQPMARAGNPDTLELVDYKAAITLDNTTAGFAVVSISRAARDSDRLVLTLSMLGLALLLSVFAYGLASRQAQGLVGRLEELTRLVHERAPLEKLDGEAGDELSRLHNELSTLPLEVLKSPDKSSNKPRNTTLTSLLLIRLDSLDGYINKLDHKSIVAYLDDLSPCLNAAARLYGGQLEHTRHCAVSIVFDGDHPSGDIYERCCYCAWLIEGLLAQLSASRNLRYAASMAALTVQLETDKSAASFSAFLQEQLTDQLSRHCKTQPGRILLANDIIETDSDQFTSELAAIPDFVVLTGLEEADEVTLEQQRDSIIAHLLNPVD